MAWCLFHSSTWATHCSDVVMSGVASQITSLTSVYSTVYLGADQRKHQSSASMAFVRGIHRGPVNSPHKGPVMPKSNFIPFDGVIMHHGDVDQRVPRRIALTDHLLTIYQTESDKHEHPQHELFPLESSYLTPSGPNILRLHFRVIKLEMDTTS